MAWRLLKFGVKAGLAGGAVYYTVEEGVWNDSTHTTELNRKLRENVKPLLKQIPVDVKLPELPETGKLSHDVQHLWNAGVKATFRFLGDLPTLVGGWSIQGYHLIQEQFSSSQQTNPVTSSNKK